MIKLLDLSIDLNMALAAAMMRKPAPITVHDGKRLSAFGGELTRFAKSGDTERLATAWANLTIYQRQIVTEAACRSGAADALAAVVGELEYLTVTPVTQQRPEPMF
jgi:hypothetical protein